jgi:hypothetical protein
MHGLAGAGRIDSQAMKKSMRPLDQSASVNVPGASRAPVPHSAVDTRCPGHAATDSERNDDDART